MDVSRLVVMVVEWLTLGSTFALVGLGLVLAFRATDVFNFAHGQFMVLPAFIVGSAQASGGPFLRAALLGILVVGVIAALFHWFVLRKTVGLPYFMPIIATLGLATIIDGAMALQFGSEEFVITIPGVPMGYVEIGGARISERAVVLSLGALALAVAVALTLSRTHLGRKLRAAGQDPVLASQSGINVHRVYAGTWFVAAALAAVAGIVYGSTTVVNASMLSLALMAFPAIIIGGLDSIWGAIAGGMLVGLIQAVTVTFWDGSVVNLVTYSCLLVVLLCLPQGLFGTRTVARV